jgi:dTDP-4-amino-4,6-dideoxygalactose transaminase
MAPTAAPAIIPLVDVAALTREVRTEVMERWEEILSTSRFVGGDIVEAFERDWARYCDRRHAIGVANGTDAIELTLRALGIGPGDEVIVPSNTFVATAEAVVFAGARPRFVDVDPRSLLVTAQGIASAVGPSTAAVIVVDLYGGIPDMAAIGAVAKANGLALIEDAAQAHGSMIGGRRAGSFGVASCFSFYPGKNLGAFGDGGCVVTDDSTLATRIRSLGDHGRIANGPGLHVVPGRNSRLDALQAAVLSVKLPKLDAWNQKRRNAVGWYRSLLSPAVGQLELRDESCHHQNVVLVPNRDLIRSELANSGIETGIHYPVPCHLQEAFLEYSKDPLPVAEESARRLLSLPLSPGISRDEVEHVCTVLNSLIDGPGT